MIFDFGILTGTSVQIDEWENTCTNALFEDQEGMRGIIQIEFNSKKNF